MTANIDVQAIVAAAVAQALAQVGKNAPAAVSEPAPARKAAGETVYAVTEEYQGKPTFKVCRDRTFQGKKKTDWLFNRGLAGWSALFGTDAEGASVLLEALLFVEEHAGDFVSVCDGVDAFVLGYLKLRLAHLGSNEDLLGSYVVGETAPGGSVSGEAQPLEEDVRTTILISDELQTLLGGEKLSDLLEEAIWQDFLAAGDAPADYLGMLATFADEGDVFDYLALTAAPGENGERIVLPNDRNAGVTRKASRAWFTLNGAARKAQKEEPAAPEKVEPAQARPEAPTQLVVTEGFLKHFGPQLRALGMWAAATKEEKEALLHEVYVLTLQPGFAWKRVKEELSRYSKVSDYLARRSG